MASPSHFETSEEMLTYLAKRLFLSIFGLLGLSVLIFVICRVMPGDPVRLALGPRAHQSTVEQLRKQMHLDKPVPVQYYYWLVAAVHGDFGESLYSRVPVLQEIRKYLPATLELAFLASILMGIGGILLGAVAGRYADRWVDNGIRLFSYVGVVTPAFVWAILLLLCFAYVLKVLPTAGRLSLTITPPPFLTGMLTIDALLARDFLALGDALRHMILPAIALAFAGMGQEARITRASISDNLNKEYISSVRGFGVPEWLVTLKFLLRPSLIPTVSILSLDFAYLISEAFMVELIFGYAGFSRYGMIGMLRKDLNVITAVVMIMGVMFIIVNLLTDVLVAWLDPRIRLGAREGRE